MTTYITTGTDTFIPNQVDGYESSRESQTIIHPILGRANPDATTRPALMRTGTLRLIFGDTTELGALIVEDGYIIEEPSYTVAAEADSKACEDAHASGGVFSLFSDERTSLPMQYVPNGSVRRMLDDETRAVWIVEVDFQEIAP